MSYVLGGGMAGMIWAFFHKGWFVVAGKRTNEDTIPMPRYIYSTPATRWLFSQLFNEQPREKSIHVGIRYHNEWLSAVSPDAIADYYEKTRGLQEPYSRIPHHVMGSSSLTFDVISNRPYGDWEKALRLRLKARMIYEDVLEINLEKKTFLSNWRGRDVEWEELVNTLPLPQFWKLAGHKEIANGFLYVPIVLTHAQTEDPFIWENSYDYIVFPDPKVSCYRITKGEKPNVGIESTFSLAQEGGSFLMNFMDRILSFRKEGERRLRYGKIIGKSHEDLLLPKDVLLFGRFGTWNPEIKIHDLVKEALMEHV